MVVTCRHCGGSHPAWECRNLHNAEATRSTAARKDVPGQHEAKRGLTDASQNGEVREREGETTPPAGIKPRPSIPKSKDRHSPGYMAAYMRKYRARKKLEDSVNVPPDACVNETVN